MENEIELSLGKIESRFADIIWSKEPVSTTELSNIGKDTFGWKKTTTFTVIKRLCDKGIFEKEGSLIKSRIKREEFYSLQSRQFVAEKFDGSLPAFLAAFACGEKFTEEEVNQLRELIANCDD